MQHLTMLLILLTYCACGPNGDRVVQHGSAETLKPVTPNLAAAVALPIELVLSQLAGD